jgi:hypothetical protein
MQRRTKLLGCTALGLLVLTGCDEDVGQPDLGVGAKLSVDYVGDSDVVGFHYLIERVSCSPGDAIEPYAFEALVDLQDQLAPGGVTLLDVFDDASGHIFADIFVTLDPGCYDVTATPVSEMDMDAGTWTPSDDCAEATEDGVEVVAETTTEVPVLVSQCEGDPNGEDGATVVLNHPPEFDLAIDDRFGFVCEVLEACASVSDPDNDPLELVWSQTSGGALFEPIAVGPLTATTFEGGVQSYEQCAAFVSDAVGDYTFDVTAYDLDGTGARIEDLLDPGLESNARLEFPLYTSRGVEPHCVDESGAMVPLGEDIARAPGCSWETPAEYFCNPANAADAGFSLADTCPAGVFEPDAAFPDCGFSNLLSCADVLALDPAATDGVYTIDPDGPGGLPEVDVLCDMTTDGGGWTLVAYNDDPTLFVDFDRPWEDYAAGFGDLPSGGNGWLGNRALHELTLGGAELDVRHTIGGGESSHLYENVTVSDEATLFTLSVTSTPSSNDGGWFESFHSGLPFSTIDSDNDTHPSNCAVDQNAGWWYADCFAMSVASGTGQVYWRNSGGGPSFVTDWIGMWVR